MSSTALERAAASRSTHQRIAGLKLQLRAQERGNGHERLGAVDDELLLLHDGRTAHGKEVDFDFLRCGRGLCRGHIYLRD